MKQPRTRVRRRWWVTAAAAGLALLLAGCGGGLGQQADTGARSGYVSGDGTVTVLAVDERQEPVTLAGESTAGGSLDIADWRGDVVVVNLWYAGCAPCRAEAPDLVEAATVNAVAGVRFVGLNVRDDAVTAQAFERTYAVPYPSILDAASGENVLALAGLVSPQSIPTTLVLDRQGRPAARILGQLEADILQGLIDDAVAEGQQPAGAADDGA